MSERNDHEEQLRTRGAVTANDRIQIFSRGRLSPEQDARALEAARALASLWNSNGSAETHPFAKLLAEDVAVESQSRGPRLQGRSRVLEQLSKEVPNSHARGHEALYPLAEVARIDGIHTDEPGLLMTRDGSRTAFTRFEFNEDCLVKRIYQVIVLPHPNTAVPTGERPDFDEERFALAQRRLRQRRRDAAQRLEGPAQVPRLQQSRCDTAGTSCRRVREHGRTAGGVSNQARRVAARGKRKAQRIYISVQTYSDLLPPSLDGCLDEYVKHPSTVPILWSIAFDDSVIEEGCAFDDPDLFFVLDTLKRIQWVRDEPIELVHWGSIDRRIVEARHAARGRSVQWLDLREESLIHGGPSELEQAAPFWGAEQRDTRGQNLIKRFCLPPRVRSHHGHLEWNRFKEYATHDTHVLKVIDASIQGLHFVAAQ